MGESRGGEGSTARATSDRALRKLVEAVNEEGRTLDYLNLHFITDGMYAVEVSFREEEGFDNYHVFL